MNTNTVSVIGASSPFSNMHNKSTFTPPKKCTTRKSSDRVPLKFHPTKHTPKSRLASTFSAAPRNKLPRKTAALDCGDKCDFCMAPSDTPPDTAFPLASGDFVASPGIVESGLFSPPAALFTSNHAAEQRRSWQLSSDYSSQRPVSCSAPTRGHLNRRSHVETRQSRAASVALELLQYYDPVRDSRPISLVKIIDVNDSFCHCLGFKRKMNLIGANILKFIPSSGHAQWQIFIEGTLNLANSFPITGNRQVPAPCSSDMMFVCKDGTHLLTRACLHILKPPFSGDEQGRTTVTALLELASDFLPNSPSGLTEPISPFSL